MEKQGIITDEWSKKLATYSLVRVAWKALQNWNNKPSQTATWCYRLKGMKTLLLENYKGVQLHWWFIFSHLQHLNLKTRLSRPALQNYFSQIKAPDEENWISGSRVISQFYSRISYAWQLTWLRRKKRLLYGSEKENSALPERFWFIRGSLFLVQTMLQVLVHPLVIHF